MFKRCGCAAHTKFVRRPTTLTGRVNVIFNAGKRNRVPIVVGRCQGATEGCTVLQTALRRRLHEEVVALNGHQTAKRIDQALMENFPMRVLCMAMQARLGKRTLLAGEMVGDSIQPTRGSFFARCALGNWLAMGGSQLRGRCQRGKQWRRRCCGICATTSVNRISF